MKSSARLSVIVFLLVIIAGRPALAQQSDEMLLSDICFRIKPKPNGILQ